MITFIPSPDIFGFSPLADTTVFFHVVSSFPSARLFLFYDATRISLSPSPSKICSYVHAYTERALNEEIHSAVRKLNLYLRHFSVDVRVGAAVVVGREKFSVKMSDHKKREKI